MRSPVSGIRPALLDETLYEELIELKGFRHMVRHRYGFDLDADKVRANVDRATRCLPDFVAAVYALENALLDDDNTPNGPS